MRIAIMNMVPYGSTGKIIVFRIGVGTQAHTDTDGDRLIVTDADSLYIFQQSKLLFFQSRA